MIGVLGSPKGGIAPSYSQTMGPMKTANALAAVVCCFRTGASRRVVRAFAASVLVLAYHIMRTPRLTACEESCPDIVPS